MENIEQSGNNVILQLNGVAINADLIAKDAEIEMNNNDTVLPGEMMPNQEKMPEKLASEATTDETKSVETSMSSTNTDNGEENDTRIEPTEGDSKVDQTLTTSVTVDSSIETVQPTESSTTLEDQKEQNTDTSYMSENVAEKSSKSDLIEAASTEQTGNNDSTVTSDALNDSLQDDNHEETNDKANDSMNSSDSSKKSPRKKGKRKNRSSSQKKSVDYTKLTKYTVSVTQRQRRYYLVMTRGRDLPTPSDDCEIFCSNIPINVLEGELVPLFERYGKIWELRLMMSLRNSKRNAGFAFVRFTSSEAAKEATEKLNDYEILPGKLLSIRLSEPNLSLFVGNIHRGLTREQIHDKISSRTTGLVKTFVKSSLYEDTKNCGFCFLEYDSHSAALQAKRALNHGNVWGRQLFVDWAQRRKQPEEDDLKDSTTLFINHLPKEMTEEKINENLSSFGTIEKVTKIKDYAFVLFADHDAATAAMKGAEKEKMGNEEVEISMAMPKSMKSRPHRYPPFMPYNHQNYARRNNHNNTYNRFRPSYHGSSNKFNMRKTNKGQHTNEEGTEQTQASMLSDVGQTQIPTTNPIMDSASVETLAN